MSLSICFACSFIFLLVLTNTAAAAVKLGRRQDHVKKESWKAGRRRKLQKKMIPERGHQTGIRREILFRAKRGENFKILRFYFTRSAVFF